MAIEFVDLVSQLERPIDRPMRPISSIIDALLK